MSGMNEDWARRRIFIEAVEWIKGKQNAIFFAGPKLFQTCAARAVASGTFHMGSAEILVCCGPLQQV
jgi:hypothetical protein